MIGYFVALALLARFQWYMFARVDDDERFLSINWIPWHGMVYQIAVGVIAT